MKKLSVAILALICVAGTARAEQKLVMNYSHSKKAVKEPTEGDLRIWLKKQPLINQKVVSIAQDARAVDSGETPPNDLRDALSPLPNKKEKQDFGVCCTIENCTNVPTALHVENPEDMGEAIVAMIRPWIVLQKAKRQRLEFRALSDSPDGVLRLTLNDLKETPLEVAAAVMPGGGVTVMLRSSVDPAELYQKEREALLAKTH